MRLTITLGRLVPTRAKCLVPSNLAGRARGSCAKLPDLPHMREGAHRRRSHSSYGEYRLFVNVPDAGLSAGTDSSPARARQPE